jgi:TonB family protein
MPSTAEPPSASPSDEAARGAQEPLTAPARLAWPKPRPAARLRLAAFLAALAAHAAVLYGVAREAPDPMAGGHGRLLDAVNITMVNSTVFEARPDVSAPPAPAAADAVEAKEGTVESKTGPQQAEQKEEKREPDKQPEKPVPPEVVEAPSVVKPPQQEKERKEASTSADAGGAAARGDVPNTAKQSAPAAASPGAVREYERRLGQAFIAAKPKSAGVGRQGTVRIMIRLRISTAGEITSVEIARSSGNKRLDDLALAAAQRTRVPVPPAGMTADQLFYVVPYDFDFR